jgi:hypothetical protein
MMGDPKLATCKVHMSQVYFRQPHRDAVGGSWIPPVDLFADFLRLLRTIT